MISLRGSRRSLFKCYHVPPQNTAIPKITDPREIFLRSGLAGAEHSFALQHAMLALVVPTTNGILRADG